MWFGQQLTILNFWCLLPAGLYLEIQVKLRDRLIFSGPYVEKHLMPGFRDDLRHVQKRLNELNTRVDELKEFTAWRKMLINGETMAGAFGCSPNYAFFVTRYRLVTPAKKGRVGDIEEVDLIIVPDLLEAHDLRINIPHEDNPKISTNTCSEVDVAGIVARMMQRVGSATNVSLATMDDALTEECRACLETALILGLDEYLDDDNGRRFSIGRLCPSCKRVDVIGSFVDFKDNDQYGRTDAIYRK